MSTNRYDYDIVIIGAGIGGLVCGCYLAKAGLKTLIVEKNAKAGGYCTSFKRDGFEFDACGHSLGSLRKDGWITRVLQELDLADRIKFTRYDPQDIIITPKYKICFWNNISKTIKGVQRDFPQESLSIKHFFNFLNNCSGAVFNSLRHMTFQALLDKYFENDELKSILSLLILGNLGLPSSKASAFTATTVYKEFTLDGGYYPFCGNIEDLPKLLLNKFKELGGRILFSKSATKITVKNNAVSGIWASKEFVGTKYVISNADSVQTYFKLIGRDALRQDFVKKLNSLKASESTYILYLGLSAGFPKILSAGISNWVVNNSYFSGKKYDINWYVMRLLPNQKNAIVAFTNAPFKDKKYWTSHKDVWMDNFIKNIQLIIPDISKYIVFKDAATPQTLHNQTLDYRGARCGWASTPSQIMLSGLSQVTTIKNLYMTGHWTTLALGIPGVSYIGRDTAKIILRRENRYN